MSAVRTRTFLTDDGLVMSDSAIAAGQPMTSLTCCRADAIALRISEGLTAGEIAHDCGVTLREIESVRAWAARA